jgi:predicted ATPase
VLVVLDNVEHLVDSCASVVDEVVRACRCVSVIVTSRERLGLPYEAIWKLHTLTVSAADEPGWVGDRPAVQLFARRAAQVSPGFRLGPDNAETVAKLCERLDDLPLAVELAAACLATDTLDELVERLDNPLHELRPPRRGSPVHQCSLWMALRRSLDCLNEYERWCFLRLASLPPCFQPAVAQEAWERAPWGNVDGRAMLTRLVDKSLLFVRHEPNGPSYGMLRLVRRFGAELHAGEVA